MAYQVILYEKADRIARITLNRPEKLNALSTQLRYEVVDAVRDARQDEDISVIVIKGAGRAFSSGYDIAPTKERIEYLSKRKGIRHDIETMMTGIVDVWNTLWNCPKLVICQVHGYCLAGGTDFALHTDMIICAEDAQFGFPAARAMGTLPTHMWTYSVGPQWAKYMVATGNSIDGKTAERIGLVLKAVPADKLEEEVNTLAETLSRIPLGLLITHKRIVNIAVELMGRGLLQQLAAEGDAIGHTDPIVTEFNEMAAAKGLKAALDWRDGQFGDYRTSASAKKARQQGGKV
ncbi:MAG: crotonase/enoyl-CoA hydratase family protein [Dehalococcoidales bacterium]|nr:crotonase/enoyl-CoA hydratase family protein [Dehalococcoidales bacterium]